MPLVSTLRFLAAHPLSRKNPPAAIGRFLSWQLRSRLQRELVEPWLDGAVLVARRGMEGATGNIYCGLHEFTEMAFVLHLLRPGDVFFDIGANIGSYTILASKVCGAHTVSFEPDPEAFADLMRNVAANGIEGLVRAEPCALGDVDGEADFSTDLQSGNRVVAEAGPSTRRVEMRRLDDICEDEAPVLIKMDVEGHEERVLTGARLTLAKPSLVAVQSEWGGEGLIRTLAEHGFERRYYDPFSRTLSAEALPGTVAELLFVRDSGALRSRLAVAPRRTVFGVSF